MLDTTASLATRPESSDITFCQSPKPSGTNSGASSLPSAAKMESALSSTMRKSKEKLCKNQMSTLMAKITVPARVRKSLARIHSRRSTLRGVGKR